MVSSITALATSISALLSLVQAGQLPFARSVSSAATTGATPFPSDLCAIDAWPVEQQGTPYSPQLPDAELTEILNQVDPERIRGYVEKLVSFGTRHTLSVQDDPVRGIGAARDWLLDTFTGFAEQSEGRMKVELCKF